ncbi:MAG TPA: Ku protein [Streptomyces sp.]|nr:Ku protein [Streptomyces sp.]
MRSIWKGSISFGLVSIPIKVVAATENHSVSFRQVHTADGGRIRYRKVCELDQQEVPGEEIGKGYQTADGETVLLTDEDLASLPLPTARTVEILGFIPAEEIDPIQLDKSYYLSADGQSAAKPYVLLREALERSGRVAVAKLAMRGRESLGMLRVYEGTLAMHTMLWPDEIRSASGVAPDEQVSVRDAELDLADTLMETLGELDLAALHDEYREAVESLAAAKAETGEVPAEAAPARPSAKVVDLMAVLETSVQAAKQSRGEEAAEAEIHAFPEREGGRGSGRGQPAKKGTRKTGGKSAEKSTAKQSQAKKTQAKKTAGKKTAKKAASKQTAAKKPAGRRPRKSA